VELREWGGKIRAVRPYGGRFRMFCSGIAYLLGVA